MKTDANTLRTEGQESAAAYPFAVDLFAGGAGAAEQLPADAGVTGRVASWDAALPKVSREEARLCTWLAAVPASLSAAAGAALARVATRLANLEAGQAAFQVLETREEELSEFAAQAAMPRAFVRLVIEPWEARVALVVDSLFAAAVVDRMLGGDGVLADGVPRRLSTTERAVLELFCAQLLARLNEEAGEPLFRLEAVADRAGEWVTGRAVVTTVRARVGTAAGVVRLVYGRDALAALDPTRSPLLARNDDDRKAGRLARYRPFCAGVGLSVLVGETELDLASLAGLESGDVVILMRHFGEWAPSSARGALRARLGAGTGLLVVGNGESNGSDGGALRLLVEEISASGEQGAEGGGRLRMDELEAVSDAESGLLESLLLTVRVELPARRISLEELTRLRAGQILELDCRATDPVELVADGRRVATGELVDIEGRLGVRVTRLAG